MLILHVSPGVGLMGLEPPYCGISANLRYKHGHSVTSLMGYLHNKENEDDVIHYCKKCTNHPKFVLKLLELSI